MLTLQEAEVFLLYRKYVLKKILLLKQNQLQNFLFMKKIFFLPALIIISCAAAFSQNKITQTRDVSGFTFVHLQIPATVYVTQENHFSVQVSATQEVLDKINTDVEDRALEISGEQNDLWKNKNDSWKGKEDIVIYISMPKPNGLQVYGSGSIRAQNNFITDYLSIEVHGSGEIVLKDFKTEKAEVSLRGSGNIEQGNCLAQGLVEELNGSGVIKVTSLMSTVMSLTLAGSGEIRIAQLQTEKLEATQGGSGTITLSKGMASSILLENAGSGEIIAGGVTGETVSAKVIGSGSISVGVVTALEASVAGSGSVSYSGSPASISKSVTGSGSVGKMQN